MHEASIVSGILRIILEEAQKHGATKINRVNLQSGLLAGIEAETLTACFELLAEGTIAEGATLEIDVPPLNCQCQSCGHEFQLLKRAFHCPQCNGMKLDFEGGHGCNITGIEAELPDSPEPAPSNEENDNKEKL